MFTVIVESKPVPPEVETPFVGHFIQEDAPGGARVSIRYEEFKAHQLVAAIRYGKAMQERGYRVDLKLGRPEDPQGARRVLSQEVAA